MKVIFIIILIHTIFADETDEITITRNAKELLKDSLLYDAKSPLGEKDKWSYNPYPEIDHME